MRRADLEHVIRAAAAVARVDDLPLPRPQRERIARLLRGIASG
ncbi:MAG TPA: hypothetical protein VKB25_09670 [Conexibacter sp.]|nr:hypothetical protein [Conexibacter sp.]